MALRALQGPTGGGAPVGGTGTTNTIPRWNPGPSTLGDSGLIDDGSQIYTTSRVLAVNTATTLGAGVIRFQVGSASALANYQGAQAGFMLPTGSGSWVEFCENSASGTTFRISKDASTGVVLNANGKNMGFNASGYTTAVASSQMVLLTSGLVGIGTASPSYKLDVTSAEVRIGASAPGANTFLYLGNGVTSAGPYGVGALQFSGQAHTAVFANSGYGAARASLGMVSGGVYTPALSADPSGLVGIGTASPASRLDVAGTITCDDAATGLKLPATPGNPDTQTLDCYQELGWTPTLSAAATWGGTAPTVNFANYTRVGRLIFFEIELAPTAATAFSATWGSTSFTLPVSAPRSTAIAVNRNAASANAVTNGANLLLPTFALVAENMRVSGVYAI